MGMRVHLVPTEKMECEKNQKRRYVFVVFGGANVNGRDRLGVCQPEVGAPGAVGTDLVYSNRRWLPGAVGTDLVAL